MPPDVLFLLNGLPAQSASVKLWSFIRIFFFLVPSSRCLPSCSFMGMYSNDIICLWTQSLRWWYQISICLDLSWNTGLIESLMKLWLSKCITFRSISWPNKPTSIFLIQMASHAVWLVAMYSTSTELSAIDLYFLLYQEIVVDHMLKMPTSVLFLLDGLPT